MQIAQIAVRGDARRRWVRPESLAPPGVASFALLEGESVALLNGASFATPDEAGFGVRRRAAMCRLLDALAAGARAGGR